MRFLHKLNWLTVLSVVTLLIAGACAQPALVNENTGRIHLPEGTPNEVREAVLGLKSPNPEDKAYYINALGQMRKKAADAIPYLIPYLSDKTVVDEVSDIVKEGREGRRGRKQTYTTIQRVTVRALAKMGRIAVDPLLEALKDENTDVRVGAASALGRIGDDRAIQPLVSALKDKKVLVRRSAAVGLGMMRQSEAVDGLGTMLKEDKLKEARIDAAWAIGEIKDPRGIDYLSSGLQDDEQDVRLNSLWSLAKFGKKAADALITALGSDDELVRNIAASTLKDMAGEDHGTDAGAWRAWLEKEAGK